ncbi:MAG: hypothetical protein ABFS12_03800 [Bacteroidota bacterium]
MFLRFIIYSILFYVVLKAVAIVWEYFKQLSQKENPTVSNSKSKEHRINKKDIIDADFEEIPDKENSSN